MSIEPIQYWQVVRQCSKKEQLRRAKSFVFLSGIDKKPVTQRKMAEETRNRTQTVLGPDSAALPHAHLPRPIFLFIVQNSNHLGLKIEAFIAQFKPMSGIFQELVEQRSKNLSGTKYCHKKVVDVKTSQANDNGLKLYLTILQFGEHQLSSFN